MRRSTPRYSGCNFDEDTSQGLYRCFTRSDQQSKRCCRSIRRVSALECDIISFSGRWSWREHPRSRPSAPLRPSPGDTARQPKSLQTNQDSASHQLLPSMASCVYRTVQTIREVYLIHPGLHHVHSPSTIPAGEGHGTVSLRFRAIDET